MAYPDGSVLEQRDRRLFFASLRPYTVFAASNFRTFMAVAKIDEERWSVIEFTDNNCEHIAKGEKAKPTILHIENISGLRGFCP